jgi:hypothetical protein
MQSSTSDAGTTRSIPAAVADELIRVVDAAAAHLHAVFLTAAAQPRAPGKWSKKEELGHLLDSAVNNHHRFIRAQETEHLVFPTYEQEVWVAVQAFRSSDWAELIDLWRLYNRHLARVIASIPQEKLGHMCTIGPREPVNLAFLIEDYLVHMKHHLRLMGVPE